MKKLVIKKVIIVIAIIGVVLTALLWLILTKERDGMAFDRMSSQIDNAMTDVNSVTNEIQIYSEHNCIDDESKYNDMLLSFKKATIDNVANSYTIVGSGFVSLIDKTTFTIVSYKDDKHIGEYISKINLEPSFFTNYEKGLNYFDGQLYYYLIRSDKKYYYLAVVPYFIANYSKFISAFYAIAFFLILSLVTLLFTSRFIDKYINKSLKIISSKLEAIKNGNFDTVVNIDICPEFKELSNNINSTIETLTLQIQKESELLIEAERLANSQEKFLSKMGHEMRTPLNAIIGIANHGLDQNRTVDDMKYAFQGISKSSEMLLLIISDILDMAEISNGKIELEEEPFDLKKSLLRLAILHEQKAESAGVYFSYCFNGIDNVFVNADKSRFSQVLENLLSNAIKFTPSGNSVEFVVNKVESTDTEITLECFVKDTGVGLTENEIDNIFVPFIQFNSNKITTRTSGSGLGLTISQHILNLMGSEIIIESEKNVGSIFLFNITFEFVIAESKNTDEDKEIATGRMVDNYDFSDINILLITSFYVDKVIINKSLIQTKVNIAAAETGKEGADLFMKSPVGYFNLIFMDTNIPNMDGYVATEKIRLSNRADSHSVPIIAITASQNEDISFFQKKLMDDFIKKPFDIMNLQEIIAKYTKNH